MPKQHPDYYIAPMTGLALSVIRVDKLKMSQAGLALLFDVSRPTVSRWESLDYVPRPVAMAARYAAYISRQEDVAVDISRKASA